MCMCEWARNAKKEKENGDNKLVKRRKIKERIESHKDGDAIQWDADGMGRTRQLVRVVLNEKPLLLLSRFLCVLML